MRVWDITRLTTQDPSGQKKVQCHPGGDDWGPGGRSKLMSPRNHVSILGVTNLEPLFFDYKTLGSDVIGDSSKACFPRDPGSPSENGNGT